jgi:hypothetical protein
MGTPEKKQQFDAILKTLTETAKSKNGKRVGIIVLGVILLNVVILNVFGTTLENKVATEVQVLKSELAGLNVHVTELEKEIDKKTETVDIATLKADAQSARDATGKAIENFEAKLNALIKTEEAKLEILAKDLENHKAYVDGLKSLMTSTQ